MPLFGAHLARAHLDLPVSATPPAAPVTSSGVRRLQQAMLVGFDPTAVPKPRRQPRVRVDEPKVKKPVEAKQDDGLLVLLPGQEDPTAKPLQMMQEITSQATSSARRKQLLSDEEAIAIALAVLQLDEEM